MPVYQITLSETARVAALEKMRWILFECPHTLAELIEALDAGGYVLGNVLRHKPTDSARRARVIVGRVETAISREMVAGVRPSDAMFTEESAA